MPCNFQFLIGIYTVALDVLTLQLKSLAYGNFNKDMYKKLCTSHCLIREMKAAFAWYGMYTGNCCDRQQTSVAVFAKTWMFIHKTFSPYHPLSNGKVENVVRMMKCLFTNCQEFCLSQRMILALLDWCNTSTEKVGTSPARQLIGHWQSIMQRPQME